MNTRQHKQLTAKLKSQNNKTVGGIAIPRQVPREKKPTEPLKKGMKAEINVLGTLSGRYSSKEPQIDVERPVFNPQPGMPGFRSFSNSRVKKRTKIGNYYPENF